MTAPDQRVNIAFKRLGVQIDTVFGKRGFILFIAFAALCRRVIIHIAGARYRARFTKIGVFGHAVGNEIHCVIAGHILILQEIGGV